MYLFWFLLIIAALIGFIISMFYSVALPFSVWSCEYYDQAITTQGGFQSTIYLIKEI